MKRQSHTARKRLLWLSHTPQWCVHVGPTQHVYPFFLLLFHVWGCRAQKEFLLGVSNCLSFFQLIQVCSRCLRQWHWKNKIDVYSHMIPSSCIETHTQAHPKPVPAWPWLLISLGLSVSASWTALWERRKGWGWKEASQPGNKTPQPVPIRACLMIAGTINEMFLVVTL